MAKKEMVYFEIFPWNKNFETGIESIDEQHKKLVDILNRLAAHLANHSSDIVLNDIFDELANYADYHFKSEEEVWNKYFKDDEWKSEHEKTHGTFIGDVVEIKNNKDNKPLDDVVYEIVSFLSKWLAYHILDTDKRCAIAAIHVMNGASVEEAKTYANDEMNGAMKIIVSTVLNMYDTLSTRTLDLMREKVLRQEAEEALEEALKEAKKATQAKSDFLAHMSHEIRTPMNAIMGMTYLALQTDLDAKQKNYISKAHDSAENLLVIINDILDFSKIEAGKLEFEDVDFELKDVVNSMLNLISFKAKEKDIHIKVKIEKDVPKKFTGDSLRLGQVLINLATNAVKFSKNDGSVLLNISLIEENEEKAVLEFSVSDEGIGMTKQQQEKLFKPFSQAEESTTRKFGGTGLGLKISQDICHMMGGDIQVESQKDKGSTFVFTIALKKQDQKTEADSGIFDSHKKTDSIRLENVKILLVEDNELNQELATGILKTRGAIVDIAENGQVALEKLQINQYDCILMDSYMPVMDGYETAKNIRKQDEFKNIPIIAVTAALMQEDIQKIVSSGMNDYIAKPIKPNIMFETIHKWVNRGEILLKL